MKVTRRRKAPARHSVSSNESSDDEHTPEKQPCRDMPVRSSERLSAKSRRTFHMPDRKAVMDAIPSLSATSKSVEKLKPRKLVNNFTRVTHRYNYDPASSDDSELDDFIDDYLSYTDDDDNDDNVKARQKASKTVKDDSCKLKQRHHTSVLESDSDSENNKCQKIKHNSIIVSNSEEDDNDDDENNGSSSRGAVSQQTDPGQNELTSSETNFSQKMEPSEKCESENSNTCDSELIMLKSHVKKVKKNKRKNLVLASDSDSCSGSDEVEDSKKRAVLIDDSDSDSQDLERLYSSNEEDEKLPSERAQLMAARREARRRLFEQLKTKKRK